MTTEYSNIFLNGEGPTRLFIGGVHGKEGLTTIETLKKLSSKDAGEGRLIIYNLPPSPYMSTLEKRYYDTPTGKRVLSLIKQYNPQIYLELHCYNPRSYSKLTSTTRREDSGVPPLIELEEGVLMGSISPLIRITFFHRYDFAFILEVPCNPTPSATKVYKDIIRIVASSSTRFEVLDKIRRKYPESVAQAEKYFMEYSDNMLLLFKKAHRRFSEGKLQKNQIKDYLLKLAGEWELPLTPKQAQQIGQSLLLYQEHFP